MSNTVTFLQHFALQPIISGLYHFLSSDGDGLGVFHHAGLVVNEGALRFGWSTFIQLEKDTNAERVRNDLIHPSIIITVSASVNLQSNTNAI